jgi:hypothetical protein
MSSIRWRFDYISTATEAVRERTSPMHAISEVDPAKLLERREQILRTVEYLREERCGLEQNAPWMDAVAYRRRLSLLATLAVWYDEETAEIIKALG